MRRVAGQKRSRDIDRPSVGLPRKVHMHRKRALANHRCDRIGAAKFGYLSCLKNHLGAVTEICRCRVNSPLLPLIPTIHPRPLTEPTQSTKPPPQPTNQSYSQTATPPYSTPPASNAKHPVFPPRLRSAYTNHGPFPSPPPLSAATGQASQPLDGVPAKVKDRASRS